MITANQHEDGCTCTECAITAARAKGTRAQQALRAEAQAMTAAEKLRDAARAFAATAGPTGDAEMYLQWAAIDYTNKTDRALALRGVSAPARFTRKGVR